MSNTVQNPRAALAALAFSPLELDPAFPLEIILDGERDDRAITQLHIHDGLEIGYCIEGAGTLHVGSKILPFHAGVVTVFPDPGFRLYGLRLKNPTLVPSI